MPATLAALEHRGWTALSTDPEAAVAFYRPLLDHAVTMLLPDGSRLTDHDTILRAMSGAPWSSFQLANMTLTQPTPDIAVVAYDVHAVRDERPYAALISSHYVRRANGWRLYFHQHTPVGG